MLGGWGLVLVLKRKTTYWRALPDGLAIQYLAGKPQTHLTVRRHWLDKCRWVTVYHQGKKIFDSNAVFFNTWFTKEV